MSKQSTYYEQTNIDYTLKLREVLKTLPAFAKDYFRAIEIKTSAKTRLSYAYDIRVFFQQLIDANPVYQSYKLTDFNPGDLEKLTPVDIEEYYEYLKVYEVDGKLVTNSERGIKRKLSALRGFYRYYYSHEVINYDPTVMIEMPKIHDKSIIRLEVDEVAELLDYVENCGDILTGQAKVYHEKTKHRDIAILTLLLGTGIRVSECVGLNINDIDFKNNGISITRKGGNQMSVYFGEEVEHSLKDYIYNARKLMIPIAGHEDALFLSTQRKRMGIQAIENMVKKYSSQITPNKKITPHKLRSTYGTNLYKETGDIYLVADVLGHKDVNTTKKHYAAMDDERRKSAARAVTLRETTKT